jgi:hypothetical protein
MKFPNGSAIVSFSEVPLHSNMLKEDRSLLADLRYASAVARGSLTGNTAPLEEEEEEEEDDEEEEEEEEEGEEKE